jgi:hypothetical protein
MINHLSLTKPAEQSSGKGIGGIDVNGFAFWTLAALAAQKQEEIPLTHQKVKERQKSTVSAFVPVMASGNRNRFENTIAFGNAK